MEREAVTFVTIAVGWALTVNLERQLMLWGCQEDNIPIKFENVQWTISSIVSGNITNDGEVVNKMSIYMFGQATCMCCVCMPLCFYLCEGMCVCVYVCVCCYG